MQSSLGNGFTNQSSEVRTGNDSSPNDEVADEVIDEVIGSGLAEAEPLGAGEELSETELDDHKSVSNPPVSRAPGTKGKGGEVDETDDTESQYELVEGWDESQLIETIEEGEPLIEAFYADTEAEEFFPAFGAALVPLAKAVLPALAAAVVKQGAGSLNPRLRKLLAQFSKLGIKPMKRMKRQESDIESDDLVELDETALTVLEQQLEALEVVIGRDDRIRIPNTKAAPWNKICHLKIQSATGSSLLGTGFFIGPRTIVTAGHCVFIHNQGGWARQITVTPGRNGTEAPFKSYTATSFSSVRGWTEKKSRNHDYGVIQLPKNAAVPVEIGAFGFANYPNKILLNKRLNLAGYPGDKPAGTLWFHGSKAKAVRTRVIEYLTDTVGGQSGSPVWIRGQGTNGQRIAVGIHTNGARTGNSATRITKPVFDNLKRWRAEGSKP
ncbi:serine protease [Leptolyngbya sp. FACHB-261]|nr:serine protease [Leptolyngbya sp. FACHB-261]